MTTPYGTVLTFTLPPRDDDAETRIESLLAEQSKAERLVSSVLAASREEELAARIDALKAELKLRAQERADLALLALRATRAATTLERDVALSVMCVRLLSEPRADEPESVFACGCGETVDEEGLRCSACRQEDGE
jgi:hypothetical protein